MTRSLTASKHVRTFFLTGGRSVGRVWGRGRGPVSSRQGVYPSTHTTPDVFFFIYNLTNYHPEIVTSQTLTVDNTAVHGAI